ncbi:hypothetical protein P691DRAFT_794239 [Macrolepiota fuliginosa MF-IS2]|uniref:Oxidoreductase AflY n=1 Tax=Macrolepiota fuliginosa MF-IS2 TaxID=1400762 RepID=A0A9P6C0K1_9AGAR|nr:hypothetical protein P691DRAFT_794239 [Macrolepiota fuliginosa MF-IS2]
MCLHLHQSGWPGISPGSTQALREVLKDNHERWHIIFNDKGFHNHSAHRALAIWSLGGDAEIIGAAYKRDCGMQRAAYASPEEITEQNFAKYLGDERFYDGYVNFFTDRIREQGIEKTLQTFVFSKKYNVGTEEMLSRFWAGLVHPMIHVGYGAEFELPGLVAEGLAQACIHPPDVSQLFPPSFFESIYLIPVPRTSDMLATKATRKLAQVAAHLGYNSSLSREGDDVHALTILARVLADPRLTFPTNLREHYILQNTVADHGDLIRDYASQWTIDIQKPGELERKIEELAWALTVMYGVAGWTYAQQVGQGQVGEFNADFFLVHLVTSVAFLPSLLARLYQLPYSQLLLLRSYLAVCLAWYIARAKPKVDIRAFYESSSATDYPLPINSLPTPHETAFPGQDKSQSRVPDPWLPLVQTTVVHPDEHLPKAIRALAAWASKFGATSAGTFSGPQGKGTVKVELPGAEYLDGTLFIRVAGLTVARLGRVGQGEAPAEFWDRTGFYKDPQRIAERKKRMEAVAVERSQY